METLKQTQVIQPKEQQDKREASTYMPPQITVHKEEDLLQTVAVLGCSPNPF